MECHNHPVLNGVIHGPTPQQRRAAMGTRERSMATADGGEIWTGPRLAARLVALNGAAPEPIQHVLYRSTRHADGTLTEGYAVPGEARPLKDAALDFWLARHRLSGADRLAVAVLVIRETLDARGLIAQCTLERRRGSADGPYCGNPARVDFAGAAAAVRLYRSHLDGRLTESDPSADLPAPGVRAPEHFAGEHKALQARFGETVAIVDGREPTLFEDMIGLSSIVHVHAPDGREVACGIGWHGTMPFVLEADFPRFATQLALQPDDAAAVDTAVRANDLVRGEIRLDENGLAVVGRRKGSETLFLLRPRSGQVQLEPYVAGRAVAGDDQQRWMRYAETYEGLTVLDAWRDGAGDDVMVLTGDASGQIWRHRIDTDGVETWRKADDEAIVGRMHREHLFPEPLPDGDAHPGNGVDDGRAVSPRLAGTRPVAEDSLLGRAEAYVRAMSALRDARDAADGMTDVTAMHVRELGSALVALDAHVAAAATQDMLPRLDGGTLTPAALARELTQIEDRLRHELALIRSVTVAPPRARLLHNDEPPFGAAVASEFPSAGYDIDEASVCLAFRRPTAAVFHCMKIIERGIGAFARHVRADDPVAAGERNWRKILRVLHDASGASLGDLHDALELIRRRWRSATLVPADKYTEEEAEQIFQAVGGFMRALAAHCDEYGRQAESEAVSRNAHRGR
jgi:hypothetical protein